MSKTNLKCDQAGILFTAALQALKEDKRSLSNLSLELGIPLAWLQRFTAKTIDNPSVNRIETILNALCPQLIATIKQES